MKNSHRFLRVTGICAMIVALSTLSWLPRHGSALASSGTSSQQLVSLYASSPQARTGQSVRLFASIDSPLKPGDSLEIVNLVTNQVVASTSTGQTLQGAFLTSNPGTQEFTALVTYRSPAVAVNWVDRPVGDNRGYQNASGQTVSLNVDSPMPLPGPITVTATPKGFHQPVYQFWWAMANGRWQSSGPFTKENTYTVLPTRTGVVSVLVYAREASAPTHENAAERAQYEAKSHTHLVNLGPPLSGSTGSLPGNSPIWVSLTTTNQVKTGQVIPVTALAHAVSNPVYQFWFRSPGNGSWQSSGNYGSNSTLAIPASSAGNWYIQAYTRSSTAPTNETQAQRLANEAVSPETLVVVRP